MFTKIKALLDSLTVLATTLAAVIAAGHPDTSGLQAQIDALTKEKADTEAAAVAIETQLGVIVASFNALVPAPTPAPVPVPAPAPVA